MSDYPENLDDLQINATNVSVAADVHPAHHNDLADAVEAVQGTLGTNPQGGEATVDARLDAIEGDASSHTSATTSVHGIADTSDLIVEGDPRLTDERDPTAHAGSHATGQSDEIEPGDIGAATSDQAVDVLGSANNPVTDPEAARPNLPVVWWQTVSEPENWQPGDIGIPTDDWEA